MVQLFDMSILAEGAVVGVVVWTFVVGVLLFSVVLSAIAFAANAREAITATKARACFQNGTRSRREGFCLPVRSRARSIANVLRDERATKLEGKRTPARRVAAILAYAFVARQSKTAEGILLPRASAQAKIDSQRGLVPF
jgi:hypothetical protein